MANNRLTRDKEHAMLGGVCAGIANRFAFDATIVRVATIALGILTAAVPVAVIYVALWIIMPADEKPPHRPSRDEITEEIRDAADRVQEAARIVTAAAKQAADEIAGVQGRRRDAGSASGASADDNSGTPPGESPGASSPPATPTPATDADDAQRQASEQSRQQQ
ncbi:MAG: PspC domain-containing protein [Chloroflexi bacterium]|nr:PspC domain-containing protein [Chloroflexota bacterium]